MATRDAVHRKLLWALRHARSLQDDIEAHQVAHPLTFTRRGRHDRAEFRATGVVEVPEEWGLRMGDVVANLRGALDHLVWFLAGEKAHRHTAFVIEGEEDGYLYRVNTKRALAGLSDPALEFIRECQPFHPTPPDPRTPEQHALVVRRWALETLHRLNNVGKHQELHVFVHGWLGAGLPQHDGVSWDDLRPGQHIEEGTLLARARGDVPADVKPVIDFEIQVEDEPAPIAARYFLGDAAAAVLQAHQALGCA